MIQGESARNLQNRLTDFVTTNENTPSLTNVQDRH